MRKRREIVPLSKADKTFFQGFYEDYKNFIFHEATAYTSTASERDDLVQDALIRLMKNISVLRGLTRYKAAYYIVITIRTTYIDTVRLRQGITTLPLDDDSVTNLLYNNHLYHQNEPSLAAQMAVKQLKDSLPERDWLVLVGKFVIGYTHEELSSLLGIAPGNIRMVLSRAKTKARKLLQQEDWIGGE